MINYYGSKNICQKLPTRSLFFHTIKTLTKEIISSMTEPKEEVDKFEGEHIYFGKDGNFKTWEEVVQYLVRKEGIQIEE